MKKLSHTDRLRLMKFVCSFAWADLEIKDAERRFIKGLIKKLHLDEHEAKQVRGWLETPPRPEEVDPTEVPHEHRQLFLETVRELVAADGEISSDERENLALFDQLLPR